MRRALLRRRVLDLKDELNEERFRLQYLVNYMDGRELLEDGCFTFPDGTTIHSTLRRNDG
jgi:hypothetical protein